MGTEVTISAWIDDARLTPGRQIFAVGDVHGQPYALEAIVESMASCAGDSSCLIQLGDLIDRGPDSAGAIAVMAKWQKSNAFGESKWLIGNHDLFFHSISHSDAETDPRLRIVGDIWMKNGGDAVLAQLGCAGIHDARAGLVRAIGEEAVLAYEAAESHAIAGNILFVHAGIQPHASTDAWFQEPLLSTRWMEEENSHFAWIRFPFLRHEDEFACKHIVVHGHTPEAFTLRWKGRKVNPGQPHQIDGYRLGLDGTTWSLPCVTGAQIEDGRYRTFMASF